MVCLQCFICFLFYFCIEFMFFFFFSSRRRHTRFDCDWSSDVCSSDLRGRVPRRLSGFVARWVPFGGVDPVAPAELGTAFDRSEAARADGRGGREKVGEIGRASCRERG